jgi:hypothetical protein
MLEEDYKINDLREKLKTAVKLLKRAVYDMDNHTGEFKHSVLPGTYADIKRLLRKTKGES